MFLWKWSLIYITWKQLHIETLLLDPFHFFCYWSFEAFKLHQSQQSSIQSQRWLTDAASVMKHDAERRMERRARLLGPTTTVAGDRRTTAVRLNTKKCFRPSSVSTLKHTGIFSKLSPSPNPPTTNNVISQLVLIHLDNSGWIVKGCYFLEQFVQRIPLWWSTGKNE